MGLRLWLTMTSSWSHAKDNRRGEVVGKNVEVRVVTLNVVNMVNVERWLI